MPAPRFPPPLHGYLLSVAPCDLEDGVGVILGPLACAAGLGFDAAVDAGSDLSEPIDTFVGVGFIEAR
jgi:hypothetical protein